MIEMYCLGGWMVLYLTDYLFPQARNYIQSLSYMPKMNFENVFIGANPLGKAWLLNGLFPRLSLALFLKLQQLFRTEMHAFFKVDEVCMDCKAWGKRLWVMGGLQRN